MAGLIYTFVGASNPQNQTTSIQTSQGTVALGQSGLFLPSEVAGCLAQGLTLVQGPSMSPAPYLVAPTLAVGAAGNPNGVYRCCVTFVTAVGETTAGPEATITVSNQQINWTSIPIALSTAGVIARKLYRTDAGGASGTEELVATLIDNTTTTYTDNLTDIALGVNVPTVDTSVVTFTDLVGLSDFDLSVGGRNSAISLIEREMESVNVMRLTGFSADDIFALSAGTGRKLAAVVDDGVTVNSGQVLLGSGQTNGFIQTVKGSNIEASAGTLTAPDVSGTPAIKGERYMLSTAITSARMDNVGAVYGLAVADPVNTVQASGLVGVTFGTPQGDNSAIAGYGQQSNFGYLSASLTTSGPITSLPVKNVNFPVAAGVYTLYANDGTGSTQTWTVTSSQPAGVTSLPVASQTPNYAYPLNSAIGVHQGGNANGGYFTAEALLGSGGRMSGVRVDVLNWVADDYGNTAGVNLTNGFSIHNVGQFQMGAVFDVFGGQGQAGNGGIGNPPGPRSSGARQDYPCVFTGGSPVVLDPFVRAQDINATVWCSTYLLPSATVGSLNAGPSTTLVGTPTFPTGTITVASTAGFAPTGGALTIAGFLGLGQYIQYNTLDATHFYGCTGGTGLAASGAAVSQYAGFNLGSNMTALRDGSTSVYISGPTTGTYAPQFNYGFLIGENNPINTAAFFDDGASLNSFVSNNHYVGGNPSRWGASFTAENGAGPMILGRVPRQDNGCTFNATTTTLDPSIFGSDAGKPVGGPWFPPNTYIVTATTGVSFTTNNASLGSGTGFAIVGGVTSPSALAELWVAGVDALPMLLLGGASNAKARSIDIINLSGGLRLGVGAAGQLATGVTSGQGVIQSTDNLAGSAVHLAGGGSGATSIVKVTGDNRLGFFGATPTLKRGAYTLTNVAAGRVLDTQNTTLAGLANIVGQLIGDMQTYGLVG